MSKGAKLSKITHRFETLQNVAVELISSHDPHELLSMIVNKAMDLMICDAGSLYLKHSDESLIFEVAVNQSMNINFEKRVLPLTGKGIAIYSFRSNKAFRIDDVLKLPEDAPYSFDPGFDQRTGYRTRSMMVQPLLSSKGETLGVLQLINRKHTHKQKWPSSEHEKINQMPFFSEEDERLLRSFAAMASASIENASLYKSIEDLFEGFVKAAVNAIETRDPPTRGHSERVALLCVDLAGKVSRSENSELSKIQFTDIQMAELRYAALLHDFGKIGVREATLLKKDKLFDYEQRKIRNRLDVFLYAEEIRIFREWVAQLISENRAPTRDEMQFFEKQLRDFRQKLSQYWDLILTVNQPTVLSEDKSAQLNAIKNLKFKDRDGGEIQLLEEDEIHALSIKKGSLSEEERLEIEHHVVLTYEFLKKIPWTKEFSSIPDIAHAHHEKLDGSGYPRKIAPEKIPVQSRIMTICDIYDALVSADRPYKKSIPGEYALEILAVEVKEGKLDRGLFKVFLEGRIFENPKFLALIPSVKKKLAA